MRLFTFVCYLRATAVCALLARNYNVTFSMNGDIVDRVVAQSVVDVALFNADKSLTSQLLEIANFNADLSDIELSGAYVVEGSLTNAIDPVGFAPVSNGLLKTHAFRNGSRVSLTTEIRFQIVAVSSTSLTCKENTFRIYEASELKGNGEKEFTLDVRPKQTLDITRLIVVSVLVSVIVLATSIGICYFVN